MMAGTEHGEVPVIGSVLFAGAAVPATVAEPEHFPDLHLDQLASAVARSDPQLVAWFRQASRDVGLVTHRQRVFADLERPEIAAAAVGFTEAMADTRSRLDRLDRLGHPPHADRWFLGTLISHLSAVTAFAAELAAAEPDSPGLRTVRDELARRCADPEFVALATQAHGLRERMRQIRFDLLVREDSITVAPEGDEPADFTDRIRALFDRFREGQPTTAQPQAPGDVPLDAMEAGLLDLVVRLHPGVFADLAAFRRRHQAFLGADLVRLDQELRFFLGYLALLAPIRAAGLPVCYPAVSDTDHTMVGREVYDLALAVTRGGRIVGNDVELRGEERVLVVSGPNQGGKTTLSRTFGQLHHLAGLGCPVPGRAVRIFLPDRILTHYERPEAPLASKLEDELRRMRAVLDTATQDSVIVLNEVFTSTTAGDALTLSRRVLDEILRRGTACLWVSFLDELSRSGPRVVSMVSTVTDEESMARTYRVVRAPADGRAYAVALVRRHGLTYDQLVERVRR